MKIGLLHYSGPPTVGGVEQTLASHAHHLAALGHEPVLLVGEGATFEEEVEVRVLPRVHSRHAEVMAVKTDLDRGVVSAAFHRLAGQIQQGLAEHARDVHVLIVHNALSLNKNLPLTSALWDLQRAGTWRRMVGWHHDLAWTRPEYAAELHPREPWDLLRRPCPGVVHVTVSEAMRRALADLMMLPLEAIHVIPPGVDGASFGRWGAQTRGLYADLGLDRANLILLLPARVTRRKNIELAIRITAALRTAGAGDVRLLVTGPPGPHNPANRAYLDELIALARHLTVVDQVHFLSILGAGAFRPVDEQTVAELFTMADALLFTSRAEGFGIPILEAGVARLPVFCSDIPPFRESGRGDVTFIALDGSPREAAEMILRTLQADPHYRLRRRVLGDFTWSKLVRDHLLPLLEGVPDG
ncbi:MAG: glycosyltransferase family 4 protein [Anaerolineales bacterium]